MVCVSLPILEAVWCLRLAWKLTQMKDSSVIATMRSFPLSFLPFSVFHIYILAILLVSMGIFFLSCQSSDPAKEAAKKRCEESTPVCHTKCRGSEQGFHRYCYAKKSLSSGAVDFAADCVGLHVGRSCQPCEEIYSVNFAGALREVSCERFHTELIHYNKRCGGCLKRIQLSTR